MHEPTEVDADRLLERMEHTLTDGYAYALALEAESLRVEREISRALAPGGREHTPLKALGDRRATTQRDLRSLRELLDVLRGRTELVRRTLHAA